VTDVIVCQELAQNEILKLAAIAERGSEHPIGKAILKNAEELKTEIPEAKLCETFPGKEIKQNILGK